MEGMYKDEQEDAEKQLADAKRLGAEEEQKRMLSGMIGNRSPASKKRKIDELLGN